MNVTAIREAMATQLAGISSAITIYAVIPKQPKDLPCLILYPPDQIDYMKTRNLDVAVFTILALVGPNDADGQTVLEGLMSSEGSVSVKAKLYADRQLNGTTSNLRMLDSSSGLYSVSVGNEANVIGCEFRVEVTA